MTNRAGVFKVKKCQKGRGQRNVGDVTPTLHLRFVTRRCNVTYVTKGLLNLLFRIIHLFIQTALSNEIKVIV